MDVLDARTFGRAEIQVTGAPAFALWRSLYFTQLLSAKTKGSVGADWIRTQVTGRAVFEPVLKRTLTPAEAKP